MITSTVLASRYVPPLSGVGVRLPDDTAAMEIELSKQESLLAQIHGEMSQSIGFVAKHREEQLWEAQRIVTQLKRQLKLHVQPPGQGQGRSMSAKEITLDKIIPTPQPPPAPAPPQPQQ